KRCLSAEAADRPKDGREVADGLSAYLNGVQERLQAAQRERAVALAREAEQRKRRRTVQVAGGVIAVVLLAGLGVSLWQAFRANEANQALRVANEKVEARFELAQKAIKTFHTGVSEEALLKNPEFKQLRTKLLKEAAGFYADQEKLLAGQTDAKSRKALAASYFE